MTLLPGLIAQEADCQDLLSVDGRALSGERLLGHATAVADRVHGLRRVAIEATSTVETVVGVVGALLGGVAAVPIPPDAGPMEREHILRDAAPEAILAAPGAVRASPGPEVVPIDLTQRSSRTHAEPDDGSAALILYTSGTTGAPKGVVLSRGAIASCVDSLADAWAWTPDDLLVHALPLFHVHGLVLGVLGALRVGCRLAHVGRPLPERYASAGGSLYFGVPAVWSRIHAAPAEARALRSARLLVSGSAALPRPVFDGLRALTSHEVIERYGMTETLITVSSRAAGPRIPGTVGTCLAGVRTRLTDGEGGPVRHDGHSLGELLVQGPTLFSGYLNRPEADPDSLTPDGWFRTGDIATITPDGTHRIVGRASTDLINSGGFRIGAAEVEDALLAHPGVREAAVVGCWHAELGQQVTAYVVAEGVTGAELIDFVAANLSFHKRPRVVHLVDRLPRNALGKVLKRELGG